MKQFQVLFNFIDIFHKAIYFLNSANHHLNIVNFRLFHYLISSLDYQFFKPLYISFQLDYTKIIINYLGNWVHLYRGNNLQILLLFIITP